MQTSCMWGHASTARGCHDQANLLQEPTITYLQQLVSAPRPTLLVPRLQFFGNRASCGIERSLIVKVIGDDLERKVVVVFFFFFQNFFLILNSAASQGSTPHEVHIEKEIS